MAEKIETAKSAFPRSIAAEIIEQQSEALTVPLTQSVELEITSSASAASFAAETRDNKSSSNNSAGEDVVLLPCDSFGEAFALKRSLPEWDSHLLVLIVSTGVILAEIGLLRKKWRIEVEEQGEKLGGGGERRDDSK